MNKSVYKIINKGFTLIELLVATTIIGIVSVVAVNLLYNTVLSRTRQDSIQSANEDVRNFISQVSNSVKSGKIVTPSSGTGAELGTVEERTLDDGSTVQVCKTFHLSGTKVEYAEISASTCTPPSSGFTDITDPNTVVSSLIFNRTGAQIEMALTVKHKDSFGELESRNYSTTVISRVSG